MQWEHRLPGMQHDSWFVPISISNNGEFCVASAGEGGVCRVWRLVDGRWTRLGDLDVPPVSAIATGEVEGRPVFATGHHGGKIGVTDAQTLDVTELGRFYQCTVRGLAWLVSDNSIAVRGSDDFEASVCVVGLTGDVRWRRKRFTPNDIQATRGVVFCLEDHGFVLFDAKSGAVLRETDFDAVGIAHEGVLLPDGRVLFIAFEDRWHMHMGGRLRLWRGESKGTVELAEDATAIGLCPNGDCIIGFYSGHLGLFHDDRVERIESWRPHFERINQISVCRSGKFATSSTDGRVGLWQNPSGDFHGEPEGGREWRGPVSATCAAKADLFLGFPDGTLSCLDQSNGKERWRVRLQHRIVAIRPWHEDLIVIEDDGSAWIVTSEQRTARLPFTLPDPKRIECSDDRLIALCATDVLTCVSLRDGRFNSASCPLVDEPITLAGLWESDLIAVGHSAKIQIYQVSQQMRATFIREIDLPKRASRPVTLLWASDSGTLFAAVGNMGFCQLVELGVDSGDARIVSQAVTDLGSFGLVDFCPDSRLLATAINCDVYAWFVEDSIDEDEGFRITQEGDIEDRPPLVASHRGPVMHLNIVAAGHVVSVGQDGLVQCNPAR